MKKNKDKDLYILNIFLFLEVNTIFVLYLCSYRNATLVEAEMAKQEGIRIISIGVGSGDLLEELNGMASDPDSENVFTVQDFDALTSIQSNVRETIQS